MIDRNDLQWYRDAIIYQLHVKSYFDATMTASAIRWPHAKARLHQGSRRDRGLGHAILSLAAARRRL